MSKISELRSQYKVMAQERAVETMTAQIKKKLEIDAALDPAFKEKYDSERMEGCIQFVIDCAIDILDGENGEVPDSVCFKIARDYFMDELWDEKHEEPKAHPKTVRDISQKPKKDATAKVSERKTDAPKKKKNEDERYRSENPLQIDLFAMAGA